MRRGLIGWSKDEVPEAAMALRVTRTQEVMQREKLDAVIAYTSFARPNAVSWYTHFVPYWNDGLVVVFPTGLPMMLAAFSKRVEPWIREVARVGDVIMTPNLGKGVIDMLRQRIPSLASGGARIGLIERDERATYDRRGIDAVERAQRWVALVDARERARPARAARRIPHSRVRSRSCCNAD